MNIIQTIVSVFLGALAIIATTFVISPVQPNGVAYDVSQLELQAGAFNVSASGTSTVYYTPDKVTVTVGVQTLADTAKQSQELNTRDMNAVIDALKALGIPENQIKTTTYQVREYRTWEDDSYVFKGYKTTHYVSVYSYDTDQAGEIIDAASEAGANYIGSVSFGLKDETMTIAKQEAIKYATQDAYDKASASADVLGAGVLSPLAVNVGYTPPTVVRNTYEYVELAADSAGATAIAEGEVGVSATVSATFRASA